jgi:superfamily I DNA and/or RNA helicase
MVWWLAQDLESLLILRAMDCLSKLILFGDSKQLSCYVAPEWRVSANSILDLANLAATRARIFSKHWAETGLLEVKQCMLNTQYRMTKHLVNFPAFIFV